MNNNYNFQFIAAYIVEFYSHQISLVYHSSLTILQYISQILFREGGWVVSLCYVSLHQRWGAKPTILYILSQKKGQGGGGLSLLSYAILQKKVGEV